MAYFTKLDDDHNHGLYVNSCNAQQTETDKIMDTSPPLESFFELPYQQSIRFCFSDQFDDFEDFSHYFNLPTDRVHCIGSGSGEGNASSSRTKKNEKKEKKKKKEKPASSSKRKKSSSCMLDFDEIKKHFGLKITEAAEEMNVGLTPLKRRCRDLKIMRWPHRQLKSLKSVIQNVEELGLKDEVAELEKHKSILERMPGMKLSEETKKLRQSCYKANYNRRRRKQNIQG